MSMFKALLCMLLLVGSAQAAITDTNVVILLDTSGSMGESLGSVKRMKAAQEALVTVLDQIPPNTNIGLLSFNGWVFDLSPVGTSKADMITKIRETIPAGGTPLGQYSQIAGTRLLQAREANKGYGIYKLLIVTDGEAGDQGLASHVSDGLRRGLSISTIGVGMKGDHFLAKQTYYMRADDPSSLAAAVSKVLAEAPDTGASAVTDFSDIAAFDPSLTKSIIANLVEVRNYPIGEAPPPPVTVVNEKGESVAASAHATVPLGSVQDGGGMPTWAIVLLVLGGIFVAVIIIGMINSLQ